MINKKFFTIYITILIINVILIAISNNNIIIAICLIFYILSILHFPIIVRRKKGFIITPTVYGFVKENLALSYYIKERSHDIKWHPIEVRLHNNTLEYCLLDNDDIFPIYKLLENAYMISDLYGCLNSYQEALNNKIS